MMRRVFFFSVALVFLAVGSAFGQDPNYVLSHTSEGPAGDDEHRQLRQHWR